MEFDLEKQVDLLKKKVYNEKRQRMNFSPVPFISPIVNRSNINFNKKSKANINDISILSTHMINSKNIQIVRLPKLPYGRHKNYNNDETFVKSHFIDVKEKTKDEVLENEIRKFKLFKKQLKKMKQSSPDTISMLKRNRKYYIYKTKGGKLYSNRDKNVIGMYELSKKEAANSSSLSYRMLPKLSISPINEKAEPTKSVKNLINGLYMIPEKNQSYILDSL